MKMPEKKSLLNQIHAKERLESKTSPFAKEEKTKPLRVKESKYELINEVAYKQKKTKVDVLDTILEAGISALNLINK